MVNSTSVEARHKVLLVDDDAVSLELMALLLAHEGHQVLRANDAGTALDLLSADHGQGGRPDVLLVDLQMPGMSGGQLAEKVRALGRPEPRLLAMSATRAQANQLVAFDEFLLKPLVLADLRRALNPEKPGRKPVARTAPADSQVVDTGVIDKLLTMMPSQALHAVFAACIADTRACVAGMRKQVEQGDAEGVKTSAHRIKGAAAMVGASRLAKLAGKLETGGSKLAATPLILDDLLQACTQLERMLLAGKFKKA